MAVYRLGDKTPQLADSAYVAEEATVIGLVTAGARASFWAGAVVRGDNETITIGDGTLVGIQAVVLNGAVIGRNCLVGAGAIVTEGKSFPDRSLILGAPAKVARELSDEQVAGIERAAASYVERAPHFRDHLVRVD